MEQEKSLFRNIYDRYQIWITLILIPIISVIVFWLLMLFMDFWTHHGEVVKMPNVVKQDYYEAHRILETVGLEVEVDSIFDPHSKHGQVLDQSPKPNEYVKPGRKVYLKINSFYPKMIAVNDDLLHISSFQAQKTLQSLGFTRIIIETKIGPNNDEVVMIKFNGREHKKGQKVPVTAEVILTVTKTSEDEIITVEEARRKFKEKEAKHRSGDEEDPDEEYVEDDETDVENSSEEEPESETPVEEPEVEEPVSSPAQQQEEE